ncbi:ALK tyrosine kinase receptor [Acipenser ruthenus]|uniref:ALK tyrosine kinase receptor n=1 Tax=Acipenser ruthenus TaxID=7906 RepID=UPI0027420974|nr:ALK tyrosine kinase receptor [Acipenser ruthenus]
MQSRRLFFMILTAAFLAELELTFEKSPPGIIRNNRKTPNTANGNTKKDGNQTYMSRLKRKNLAVDFAVPALFRTYLSELMKRPLNSDCQTYNSCYTVRSSLRMRCQPLQRTVCTLLETESREPKSIETDNSTGAGQLPYKSKRPPSKVLNLGLSKPSKKSNQIVIEIGETDVRTGCGSLASEEDAAVAFLKMDLSRVVDSWLGAEGGRLRVRLMPERRAQVPEREDSFSAAIRAADPRLFLQITSRGENQTVEDALPTLSNYWNFTWTLQDDPQFPSERVQSEISCDFEAPCDLEYASTADGSNWRVKTAKDLSEEGNPRVPKEDFSEKWLEGHFLFLNSSGVASPAVLSPWLKSGSELCSFEASVYLHNGQTGRYTISIIECDKQPREILSTERDTTTGWLLLRVMLGRSDTPFRISMEYSGQGTQDTAALDSINTSNCTTGSPPGLQITLQGKYTCRDGTTMSLGRVCNFQRDCAAEEDEGRMCRDFLLGSYCSFEEGDCGWQALTSASHGTAWGVREGQHEDHQEKRGSCPFTGRALVLNSSEFVSDEPSVMRSPLFPPPLKNSPCQVWFSVCAEGSLQGALSLWLVENSTREEESRMLWGFENSSGAKGWSRLAIPVHGVSDRFWLQFTGSGEPGSAIAIDNISLSLDCFLASNGDLPPKITPVSTSMKNFESTNQNNTTAAPASGHSEGEVLDVTEFPDFQLEDLTLGKRDLVHMFSQSFHLNETETDKSWNFGTCGTTGPVGPTTTQCSNTYRGTSVNVSVGTEGPLRGVQMWRVPATETYRIMSYGAAGGRSVLIPDRSFGLFLGAHFFLKKDELLYILVGQQGEDACPNSDTVINRVCQGETSVIDNKTQSKKTVEEWAGGGGGGGGATFIFKMKDGVPVPLLIAGGGGGRGYSGKAEYPMEILENDTTVQGVNGVSGAAGGGGGWDDKMPVSSGGLPLLMGALGGRSCPQALRKWQLRGGFGGGGGGCSSGGGGGGYIGGSTGQDDDPHRDGEDGVSFINTEGDLYLPPLKVMESHGEVRIELALDCSHCQTRECHLRGEPAEPHCYCEAGFTLAPDQVSCIDNDNVKGTINQEMSRLPLHLVLSVVMSALIAALLFTISGIMFVYRRKHPELQSIQLELQSPECKLSKLRTSTIMTDYNPNYCFAGKTSSVNDLKEVSRRNISLMRGLGHGAFGEVYEGQVFGIPGERSPMQVAVKTLPEVCSEQDELDFLMEALIISKFNHQNIVRCIGVSLQALPRFILLELMAGGDLKSFLRETRPRLTQPSSLSMVDLLNVARDIAQGCQYLEENHFIHRDIAARNCLLTCKDAGRVAKIGDFGMARDIYRACYYRKGGRAMLPVKWMPPEAFMEGIFTSKTDTWSFGVLLWEIFSLGYMPYPSRSNQEVLEFVTSGGRMDPPKNCPGPVYRIMTQTWQHQPEDRPNFSTILERVDYCLQDPDVVNTPLPVEYGPVPEEEETVPMRPEDPGNTPPLLVSPFPERAEEDQQTASYLQPTPPSPLPPLTRPSILSVLQNSPSRPPPLQPALQQSSGGMAPEEASGGHVNLAFSQTQPPDLDCRNGKPTNLWNPTYGSWYLDKQRAQVEGEGDDHEHRTAGDITAQAPPRPPAVLLEPSALSQGPPAIPLFRLRRLPCGNISYGYQEQGLPLDPPPPPLQITGRTRTGSAEEGRPLLVSKVTAILQDPPQQSIPTWDIRLPLTEDVSATAL